MSVDRDVLQRGLNELKERFPLILIALAIFILAESIVGAVITIILVSIAIQLLIDRNRKQK